MAARREDRDLIGSGRRDRATINPWIPVRNPIFLMQLLCLLIWTASLPISFLDVADSGLTTPNTVFWVLVGVGSFAALNLLFIAFTACIMPERGDSPDDGKTPGPLVYRHKHHRPYVQFGFLFLMSVVMIATLVWIFSSFYGNIVNSPDRTDHDNAVAKAQWRGIFSIAAVTLLFVWSSFIDVAYEEWTPLHSTNGKG